MKQESYSGSWLNYFMDIADAASRKSHCISRNVGAVIVKDKQILSTGFNGLPSGFPNCSLCYGGERVSGHGLSDLPCVHAEANAILQCSKKVSDGTKGAVMFCTNMPCNDCLKLIIQAGIVGVYFREPYYLPEQGERLREYLVLEAMKVNGFAVMQVE